MRQDNASAYETTATIDFQDPFDPERFNRRFLPAAEEQKSLSPTAYSGESTETVVP